MPLDKQRNRTSACRRKSVFESFQLTRVAFSMESAGISFSCYEDARGYTTWKLSEDKREVHEAHMQVTCEAENHGMRCIDIRCP